MIIKTTSEQEFYKTWHKAFEGGSHDPASMAILGGSLTMEPAFLFLAGYQAAIRASFSHLDDLAWYAYAASEDRSANKPKPGLSISNNKLVGFKTWIASSEFADQLIVKIGTGIGAKYALVKRSNEGLLLSSREDTPFLSAMSQGIAEFQGVEFEYINDISKIKDFARNEPYYIYIAFLSSLRTFFPALEIQSNSVLTKLSGTTFDLPTLDLEVQSLLKQMVDKNITMGSNWRVDKKLLSMYSKFIQKSSRK
jgi:hypothetical protein